MKLGNFFVFTKLDEIHFWQKLNECTSKGKKKTLQITGKVNEIIPTIAPSSVTKILRLPDAFDPQNSSHTKIHAGRMPQDFKRCAWFPHWTTAICQATKELWHATVIPSTGTWMTRTQKFIWSGRRQFKEHWNHLLLLLMRMSAFKLIAVSLEFLKIVWLRKMW